MMKRCINCGDIYPEDWAECACGNPVYIIQDIDIIDDINETINEWNKTLENLSKQESIIDKTEDILGNEMTHIPKETQKEIYSKILKPTGFNIKDLTDIDELSIDDKLDSLDRLSNKIEYIINHLYIEQNSKKVERIRRLRELAKKIIDISNEIDID